MAFTEETKSQSVRLSRRDLGELPHIVNVITDKWPEVKIEIALNWGGGFTITLVSAFLISLGDAETKLFALTHNLRE